MANLMCNADGNLTGASTWASVDSTALLSTSTGSTVLTTSDQDSTPFQPGAITIDAIALNLNLVAASPAHDGTLTITLRNSSDNGDVVSLAYNVAQLVNNGENYRGGWYLFKLDASYLLVAGKNYIIRLKLSATAGKPAVSFMTNGTVANWQHMLRTTSAATAAAGDDLFILGELAAAATWTTRTVTMDSTANTDYGAGANESEYSPSLVIGKNGTLTWSVTAATAYILKLSGSLMIFPGGKMTMGDVGAECPRNSSMSLQFDTAASKAYTIRVCGGLNACGQFIAQGLSRTSGKNIWYCYLNGNLAQSGTTCNVDTDTGWLSGDSVMLATTSTYDKTETKALSGDAGASSFTIAAAANAHSGTAPTAGEILLLTRNVNIAANNLSYPGTMQLDGKCNFDWARFNGQHHYTPRTATTEGDGITCDYCVIDGCNGYCVNPTGGDFNYRHCVFSSSSYGFIQQTVAPYGWTLQDIFAIAPSGGGTYGFYMSECSSVQLSDLRAIGWNGAAGFNTPMTTWNHLNPARWTAHGQALGFQFSGTVKFVTFTDFVSWGNSSSGISSSAHFWACAFPGLILIGNATVGWWLALGSMWDCKLMDGTLAGLDTNAQAKGIVFGGVTAPTLWDLTLCNTTLGHATGRYVAHATNDIDVAAIGSAALTRVRLHLNDSSCQSATGITTNTSMADLDSYWTSQRHNQTNATHKRHWFRRGTVAYETTTYKTALPSIKMTPNSAANKLSSGIMRFAVASGVSFSPQVQVRKDATYNGNPPRLIARRNDAIGIIADTVLDTFASAVDTWELLTDVAIASPLDDGVVECYVDCDGTAGNVYLDEWAKT